MEKTMIIKGRYNEAKVFTDNIEQVCQDQIRGLCSQLAFAGTKIRIMPDCHFGKGCVVGFTMPIIGKVVPNIVGVDIGCGMLYAKIPADVDVKQLDEIIGATVPSGMSVHEKMQVDVGGLLDKISFDLRNRERIEASVGTLGSGNHFISVEQGTTGTYLIIHTGSRNLGKQVCEYHQALAGKILREDFIGKLKAAGREKEIQTILKRWKHIIPPNDLCYLEGPALATYLQDMRLSQLYADINRQTILQIISAKMGWGNLAYNQCIHNYISQDNVIRKGAVSARAGEQLLIPLNMRDGSLLCIGKGNADWNESAPHGAGRVMSRTAAKKKISLTAFQQSMQGIYSTSVTAATLDEAPFAYKQNIEDYIGETVGVVDHLIPIYNFKAEENKW